MSTLSDHHRTLTNGVGKCSVPMWCCGMPAGFCDEPAYGPQRARYWPGEHMPYAPGLACPNHGGPSAPPGSETAPSPDAAKGGTR